MPRDQWIWKDQRVDTAGGAWCIGKSDRIDKYAECGDCSAGIGALYAAGSSGNRYDERHCECSDWGMQ